MIQKTDDTVVTSCLLAVFAMLIVPIGAIWAGYVVSVLWGWFAVPALHAPPLTPLMAYGLMLIVYAVKGSDTGKEDKTEPASHRLAFAVAKAFLSPCVSLLAGWIVRQFA